MKRATKSDIVPEPPNNVYGKYKVLRRTVGDFAVLDMQAPLGSDSPVFRTEHEARKWAAEMSGRGR